MCGCSGGMHGCTEGGMCGFIWGACVVLFGGHAWFYSGGHAWFYFGGHAWFYSGGHAWFYSGGACVVLFSRAGVRGFFSFSGYNEIRSMSGRYASYWNAFLFLKVIIEPNEYLTDVICLSIGKYDLEQNGMCNVRLQPERGG